MRTIRSTIVWWTTVLTAAAVTLAAPAQDASSPTADPGQERGVPERVLPIPELGPYDPATVEVEELRLRLIPRRREALEAEALRWVTLLEEHARCIVAAELALRKATEEDRPALGALVDDLKTSGSHLLDRANTVVSALRDKGGEVEAYRQFISSIASTLVVVKTEDSQDEDAAAAEPPVEVPRLEPYAPLEVPVDELKMRLRRFRKADLTEEVEIWMKRLEAKAGEIAATDIAARSAEGDNQQQLVELGTRLKEERARLVERAGVAIDLLEARGGDGAEYRQYVETISSGLVEDLGDLSVTDVSAINVAWKSLLEWGKSKEGGLKVLGNIGRFLLVLLAFWVLSRVLAGVARHSLARFRRTSTLLRDFLVGMLRKATILIGVVVAISMLGVNIGPLAAAIGAAGLVLGFALQGTLSNFASGIMILLYRPFDVGDIVDAAGVSGKVEAMTMVSTTINTFDNRLVIVPNNSVWSGVITNVTGKPTRRVDMEFGIAYSDDIAKAKRILEEIVNAHPQVLKEPAPNIRLHTLADSSVNFIVRPWTRTEEYWDVYWDVTRSVKEHFDAEGISIPFPQRELHVRHLGAMPGDA